MKILFTSTQRTSFILQDLYLLQRHFAVNHLVTRGVFAPFNIVAHIVNADVTFTWFASTYSFVVVLLARLLKKRSIVVIGGVDVARVPEMQYGIWLSPWKAQLVRYAIRNASKVLAVDSSLKRRAIELAGYSGSNIESVPTGYDPAVWISAGEKEPFVLTVAKCTDESKVKVKGLDMLFESAGILPTTQFVVIGLTKQLIERVKQEAPVNVEFIQFVEQDKLLGYYQRAKVYCQPSFIEGFPNSVCEAMLCECVPVGTDVGGIPTAIGNSGFLVPHGNSSLLADAIRKALTAPRSAGENARAFIAGNFTLEKRETALLRILRENQN